MFIQMVYSDEVKCAMNKLFMKSGSTILRPSCPKQVKGKFKSTHLMIWDRKKHFVNYFSISVKNIGLLSGFNEII